MDLQLPCQCGNTVNCVSSSIRQTRFAETFSQQANKAQQRLAFIRHGNLLMGLSLPRLSVVIIAFYVFACKNKQTNEQTKQNERNKQKREVNKWRKQTTETSPSSLATILPFSFISFSFSCFFFSFYSSFSPSFSSSYSSSVFSSSSFLLLVLLPFLLLLFCIVM